MAVHSCLGSHLLLPSWVKFYVLLFAMQEGIARQSLLRGGPIGSQSPPFSEEQLRELLRRYAQFFEPRALSQLHYMHACSVG